MEKFITDLNKRHKSSLNVCSEELLDMLNSCYKPEQVKLLVDFCNGRDIQEIIKVYHLAESRIRNFYFAAIDKIYHTLTF